MQPPNIAVEHDELENLIWPAFFGRSAPVELEIGCGKAGFLLRRAQALPDRNFLGIEWANKFYKYAVDRMQRWDMKNVRMLRTDASHFVIEQCPRDSLSVLHVYHPDPWPKKRHHRRRLIQPPFIEAAIDCLIPRGRWALQTDHAGYFEHMCEKLKDHPRLTEVPFDDPTFGVEESRVHTNFENKYVKEGRPIYQLAFERLS